MSVLTTRKIRSAIFRSPTEERIVLPRAAGAGSPEPIQWTTVAQVRQGLAGLSWRDFLLVGGAIVLVAIVGLLYLVQSAEITRTAYRANEARAAWDRARQENSVLRVEVTELERLDRVEERAFALGLEKAQQVQFLRYRLAPGVTPGVVPEATPQVQ